MKKVLLVFGTRPEAIKMAPVVKEFQEHSDKFETVVCVTAQHRELLDQVLKIFKIVPNIDLNIMQPGQDLTDITTSVLIGMSSVLKKVEPDIVLVHGDTTTSAATALAAFYKQIPVGHVEAGLRTYNIYSPWPEEINRQITSRIAAWHFAPTDLNKHNLINEGISADRVFVTGNTVVDAMQMALHNISRVPAIKEKIKRELLIEGLPLNKLESWQGNSGERKMILITGHRRENFGKGFQSICEGVKELAFKYDKVDFVYPVHMNPNVQKTVSEILNINMSSRVNNIYLLRPLEYLPFLYLMKKSLFILTDSGGVQEEAPSLGKPVIVMRNLTERPEGLISGIVKITGTDKQLIKEEVIRLLEDSAYYLERKSFANLYGDGKSSQRIVSIIQGGVGS